MLYLKVVTSSSQQWPWTPCHGSWLTENVKAPAIPITQSFFSNFTITMSTTVYYNISHWTILSPMGMTNFCIHTEAVYVVLWVVCLVPQAVKPPHLWTKHRHQFLLKASNLLADTAFLLLTSFQFVLQGHLLLFRILQFIFQLLDTGQQLTTASNLFYLPFVLTFCLLFKIGWDIALILDDRGAVNERIW